MRWHYVRCVRLDGSEVRSCRFGDAEEADRIAKLCRKDPTLAEVIVDVVDEPTVRLPLRPAVNR